MAKPEIFDPTERVVEELREAHNDGAPFRSDTKPKVRTGRAKQF